MVDDHTTNCDGEGNFLVVNGQTGQTGSAVFWEQTMEVDTGTYKLCASFKHLEQCCFDVTPTIDIIINERIRETVTVDQTDGSDPCSWQDYTFSFEVTNSPITIQFALDETALGDGNDLAVDDIIFGKLPPAPIFFSITDNRPRDPNLMVTADPLPSPECQFEWFVAEVDVINSISPLDVDIFPNTQAMGGSQNTTGWPWNSISHTFPNYDGTNNPVNSPNGQFDRNLLYFVEYAITGCDCYADSRMGRLTALTAGRLANFTSDEIRLSPESRKMVEEYRKQYREGTLPTNSAALPSYPEKKPDHASLAQNEPNPFDNSTSISYFLPDGSQSAMLRITGIDGSEVETMSLPVIQNGQVRIDATQYWEGIYFYSLVVDGRVVETKRMVLTR